MGSNPLSVSNVFLSILAGLYLVANLIFNFSFLIILFKMVRFRKVDRSFFLVTHMIIVDFFSAFFILIIGGYGVFNSNYIESSNCHIQTYFINLFLGITFHGLMVLSVERFIRYQAPIWHINTFTRRLTYDEEERLVNVGKNKSWIVFVIIAVIWSLNIFMAFIPFFNNFNDIQFFDIQSQCDYIYENFQWWLWLFFWFNITLPFLISMVFYILTFRLIYKAHHRIRMRKAQFELEHYGERRGSIDEAEHVIEGVDITRQPFNRFYYDDFCDPDVPEEEETYENDDHVRTQLLTQYKYDTERSQTITYCIIMILSYFLVFPVFVIHFYRTFNNPASSILFPDNPTVVAKSTYTTFVWISYVLLILKSAVCLIQNPFFRDNLYQSANMRGFRGSFDYEVKRLGLGHLLKSKLNRKSNNKKTPKVQQQDDEEQKGKNGD